MVPEPLAGVYQQYKLDTDSVAQWLASAALANGYPPDKLPRAVSKADALGTVSRKGSKNTAANRRRTSYRITIQGFTMLSEYVAGKQVQVPPKFASTLDRLIVARTEFREELAKHSNGTTDKTSDQQHSFFVLCLERFWRPSDLYTSKRVALQTSRTHNSQLAASKGHEGGILGGYDLLQRDISNDELYGMGN
ncbi:hypothetical protein LQW54_000247 [Pestalotiopsis sp. IQ-011]